MRIVLRVSSNNEYCNGIEPCRSLCFAVGSGSKSCSPRPGRAIHLSLHALHAAERHYFRNTHFPSWYP